jgi:hypothetical protein
MRRLALLLTVALVALGVAAAAAGAMLARDPQPSGPHGVHITPLSKGTIGASVNAKAAGLPGLSQAVATKCTTPSASSSTTRPSSRSRSTWPSTSLSVR